MDDTPAADRTRDEITALPEDLAKLRASTRRLDAELQARETANPELDSGEIDDDGNVVTPNPPCAPGDCKIGGTTDEIADAISAARPVVQATIDYLRIVCAPKDPDRTLDQILADADAESEAIAAIIADSRLTADGEMNSKLGPDFDPDSDEWASAGEAADNISAFRRIVRPLMTDEFPVDDEPLPET